MYAAPCFSSVSDVVERLRQVELSTAVDIALYASRETLAVVQQIRSQPNTVTKHFDLSGAFRVCYRSWIV